MTVISNDNQNRWPGQGYHINALTICDHELEYKAKAMVCWLIQVSKIDEM